MSRPLRIYFPGAWYHVMNRGIDHQLIFFNEGHKNAFIQILKKTIKVYGIEIHAYCLMDNHYHLIVHTPRANISDTMRYLNSNYARFVNINMKRDGPLFKGRFKALVISADDYLLRLSRYIHLNPLEANMVRNLESYQWSSYQYYLNEKYKPDWLTTSEIIDLLGRGNFRNVYKKFVEIDKDIKFEDFYKGYNLSPVYSNDKLRNEIDEHIKKHSLSAEIVGADRILNQPTMQQIVEAVGVYFDIDSKDICKRSECTMNIARRIAMFICREFGGYSLREIGELMTNISYKTVSCLISRVRKDVNQLRDAEAIIEQIRLASKYLINAKD